MKIEDVMTRRVVAARADSDLSHVARLMWENDCGSIPVVDAEDQVVGMVTDRDACMGAYFGGRSLRELRAAGCMASVMLTCRPDDRAAAVVALMGERRVRRVPVTDDGGRLVGIVSLGDVVNAAGRAAKKDRKALQEALLGALAAICAQPERDAEGGADGTAARGEVVPAPRSKRGGRKSAPKPAARAAGAKSGRRGGRKRAKV